jgi:hypothetical protein
VTRIPLQATHVGKVVVSGEAPLAASPRSIPSVAITGGSGGLGLMISSWLVQRTGKMYVLLLSRSGRTADPAAASLTATPACISSAMADAGSSVDVAAALAAAAFSPRPALQMVLHASGVLADSLLDKQSAASFRCAYMSAARGGCLLPLGSVAWPCIISVTMSCEQASICTKAGCPGGRVYNPPTPASCNACPVLLGGVAAGRCWPGECHVSTDPSSLQCPRGPQGFPSTCSSHTGQLRGSQRGDGCMVAQLAGRWRRLQGHPVGSLVLLGCAVCWSAACASACQASD